MPSITLVIVPFSGELVTIQRDLHFWFNIWRMQAKVTVFTNCLSGLEVCQASHTFTKWPERLNRRLILLCNISTQLPAFGFAKLYKRRISLSTACLFRWQFWAWKSLNLTGHSDLTYSASNRAGFTPVSALGLFSPTQKFRPFMYRGPKLEQF